MLLAPLKQFRIKTQLPVERCREMLAIVVQPQKAISICAVPDATDNRLVFKGKVKSNRSYVRYIDRSQSPQKRTNYVLLKGALEPSFNGTDIVVRATLEPLFAAWISFLSLPLALLGVWWAVTVQLEPYASQSEKIFSGIGGIFIFLHCTVLPYVWFTHIFAKAVQKPFEALKHIFDSAS